MNLIGDHTDYSGGLVLPIAIDRGTYVEGVPGGHALRLRSESEAREACIDLEALHELDPARIDPPWARYVAAIASELRLRVGFQGIVRTELPIGAGLSSSAALEVALALALGFEGEPLDLARLCQRAEWRASAVPCGIMDPLVVAAGIRGHALCIDCHTLEIVPVPVPASAEVVVLDSGVRRTLDKSAYAQQRAECEAAAEQIGPLWSASPADVGRLQDPRLSRRAHHVICENLRVRRFAAALRSGDLDRAGELMQESHQSLRDDFEVSHPELDRIVEDVMRLPGVYGVRLTGAGFGGCLVALVRPGTHLPGATLRVRAANGAWAW